MSTTGRILAVDQLSKSTRDAMFALMTQYYDCVRRRDFDTDLAEKHWVIAMFDHSGRVCGFSTQMLLEVPLAGRTVRALFSGDTIVDRQHWARNPLTGLWGRLSLALVDRYVSGPLYWFLISKGYKTYRFLPLFFREFYPRADRPTPPREQHLLGMLGQAKFPASFDPDAGIVRSQPDSCRLRTGVAELTPRHLADPDIRFFCERNPRHAQGDELCCLAPLSRENFTRPAWKAIRAAPECLLPESLEPQGSLTS